MAPRRAHSLAVLLVLSTASATVSAWAAPGAAAQGSSVVAGPASDHPTPPSQRGTGRLISVGSTSPGQDRGRRSGPGGHLPFFAHGGPGQKPSSSSSGASGAPVVALQVPGPSGSSSGLSASGAQSLTTLDGQVAALGTDQSLEPPDNGLGTNGSYLVELVNDSGNIWSISNGALTSPYGYFDLNKFFYVPSGYTLSDPRILWDPFGQRWIASGVAFSSGGASMVDLDVSSSADPEGGWNVYYMDSSSDVLHDQPKIGISQQQLVVSWNDFLVESLFQGATTWVLDRAGVESGSFFGATTFGPDSSEFSVVPAWVVNGPDAYAVWNDSDCSYSGCSTGSPTLGVVQIGGTPTNGSVTWTTWNPSIAATVNPPGAIQPAPGNPLDTDDDRLLGATWSNNTLVTAGNDACTPPGDSTVRPCLRIIAVSLSGGTPTVTQDFDAGAAGAALYYPAVTLDGSGDMAVVYTASSSSVPASVGSAVEAAGSVDTLSTGPWLEEGSGYYSDGNSSPRWGDYSGAVTVPGTTAGTWGSDMWVAGEYTAQSGTYDWGTAAAQLVYGSSAPDFSLSATPSSQTVAQGQATSYTVTMTPTGGFGDSVGLSVTGLPSGAQATFDPTSVSSSSPTSLLTVTTASSTSSGTYTLTVTGTDTSSSSSLTHSTTVTLVVQSATTGSFSLSASPGNVTLRPGQGATYTLSMTTSGGFSGSVTLSVSGIPGGATATFDPTSLSPSSTSSTLTVATSKSTPAGTYTLTITGTSGSLTSRVTVKLKVR
jgi:hypothetical protein